MGALNGKQVGKLMKLVLEHFSGTLEQVVFLTLDRPLEVLATGRNLEEVVFRLLVKLERQEVDLLIEGLKDKTSLTSVHAALDEALATGSTLVTDPSELCESLLVSTSPPIPFINRSKWREMLNTVADTSNDYRALSMTGKGPCGKSYSWHLLEKVARGLGILTHKIDLKQAGWTLRGACEEINTFLGLPPGKMREFTFVDSPAADRVAHKFASWVSIRNAQRTSLSWLVFDGLSGTPTAQTKVQQTLVPALLKKAEANLLPNLKIFLLGARADTTGDLHLWSRHEDVAGLTVRDIESFLTRYAESRGQRLKTDELTMLVERITGGATDPFDLATMRQITAETRVVIEDVLF